MDSAAYGRRIPTAMKVKTLEKADTDSLPGIQLNDRQLKLYKARKSGVTGGGMKDHNRFLLASKKPQYSWKKTSTMEEQHQQPYLGQEPTQTAETVANTFSEDTSSRAGSFASASNASYSSSMSQTSSGSKSRRNAANAFYGQRLEPSERKRYDDQGNTWRDSQSEASAASAASSVSAALSAASRNSRATKISSTTNKSSSSLGSMARLRQLQQQRGSASSTTGKMSSTGYSFSSNRSTASAASDSKSEVSVASSAKMSSASRSVVSSSSSRYAPTTMKKADPDPTSQEDEIMNDTASAVGSSLSAVSKSGRPALTVATKAQSGSFSQKLAERKNIEGRPSGLGTQKEKSKFLRGTMMQWAKSSSSASTSSSSVVSAAPSALKSTRSITSTSSKSSKSSRRLSFAPKKAIITGYRSPKSLASGGSGAISPKEIAIMRKVADRNRNKASTRKKSLSPKNTRKAAGKMIKSSSSRMKKLLSSSFSSSSSSLEKDDAIGNEQYPMVEIVKSKRNALYDDSGQSVNESAISLFVNDAPDDEAASIASQERGHVDRKTPIVMEEDVFGEEKDDQVIFKNQQMRKRGKRGRSSIFKARIGTIGMAVMDDMIESNDELSSDDDEEDDDSMEEEEADGVATEVFDVSIHQARSVKSTITPRRPKMEEPRNINNILDENKEFLQEMREGPLKQALNTPSIRNKVSIPTPVPTMSESYDVEIEEYTNFSNALKAELSGTHSKLYDSFQNMFHRGEHDNIEPVTALSSYPGSLDLKTKECISKMSKYLNTEHDIECLISSQITKDTDVRNYVMTYNFDKEAHRSIKQVHSSDSSINGGDDGSQFEVTVGKHARATSSVGVSSINDSRFMTSSQIKSTSVFKLPPSATAAGHGGVAKFSQVKLKSRSTNDKNKNGNVAVPSSWTKVRLKPVGKPKTTGRPTNVHTESSETAEFHRIVLRKTPTNAGATDLKTKHFDTGLQTAPSSLTDASGTQNKPIDLEKTSAGTAGQPIKLTTPTTAPKGSEKRPIELTTPMSGTELKPIAVKDTKTGAEENPIKLAPSTGYDSVNPIQLVPSKGDESVNPIVLAPSIDLNLNEGSVMVPLETEAQAGSGIFINVLVGKNGITKVQSIPGQESTKANIIWRLERSEVKSALLDMSTFSVKLIVSSDSNDTSSNKDLKFPTSTHCMKFANALHEMKESDENVGGFDDSASTVTEDASVYVEQLSDEEQKILEEFRQRKKNPKSNDIKDMSKELLSKTILDMHNLKSAGPKPMSVVNGGTPSSPVSEVSSATSLIDNSKTEKKYQLMLKMKVPVEAIRTKMKQDGIDPVVIAKVLGEKAPKVSEVPKKADALSSSGGSVLSLEDEKGATVYRKMLKMMIPPEAVAHKMKKDGVNQKIIASVLGKAPGDPESQAKEASSALPLLTIPEQAAAQKYQRMLKMSVPKEAVEHKMKKEGVDAKIIAFVLGQSSDGQSNASSPSISEKASSSSLTAAEESSAKTYRRMLKMNIPKEAVHHKMMNDGVSEKIISAVLGKGKKKQVKGKNNIKKGGFGFGWIPIDDDVSIVGSVWSKTKTASEVGALLPDDFDISKHVEEFRKKDEKAEAAKKSTGKSGQGSKEMAKLINGNRAQNVAITLKAFNDFTFAELAQNIGFLDPFGKIKGDRALFMKDLLPTGSEVKAIKAYTGSNDLLDTAEKWFQHIVNVKRIEQKVQVMRTMETFKMDAIILGRSFQLLTDVCNQVMSSDRLPDLLDMVRQIGNRMNEGRADDAAGFKLDFLPRLSQTKGSDKKTTALDLVVLIFCTRNQREALMLSDDYPDIQEASRLQFDDLSADVRGLEGSFHECKLEFESIQREHDISLDGRPPQSFSKVQTDSRSESALTKPRKSSSRKFGGNDINTDIANRSPAPGLSLMDVIKSRNGMARQEITPSVGEVLTAIQKTNEEVRKSLSPRASLRVLMEAKNNGMQELSLDASIRNLEKFVGEANYVVLPKLQSQRDAAVEACKDLASFFCEAPNEKAASNLLKILAGFATGIDQSLKKHDEQQKILARREASMKKKNNKSSSKSTDSKGGKKSKLKLNNPLKKKKRPVPELTEMETKAEVAANGEKKSLVLMVNEMLKVAGDKEIEQYRSGKSTATAGSRLEQIYEEENNRKASDKEDILTAIRRRRSVSTNLVPQQALTDLKATLSQDARDDEEYAVRRKSRYAQRWGSRDPPSSEASTSLPTKSTPKIARSPKDTRDSSRRKSRVANRWSSKQPDTPSSDFLSTASDFSNDIEIQKKRRQSVVNRWASKSPKSEVNDDIADTESDIGAFQEMLDKRKQKAFNRWASKRT